MNQEEKKLPSIILDSLRSRGLNLERLSQLSGVSERFLSLLIEGKFEKLPSRPYAHGYLIKIANVLSLDGEQLWQEFLKNDESIRRSGKNDHLPQNRFLVPKLGKWAIIGALAVLIVGGYLIAKTPSFLGKPRLEFQNLKENKIVVEAPSYLVKGKIDPDERLTLNGKQIYPDKSGFFEETVELQPGFNTLTFKVKKFLGKEYVVSKQIFYEAPEVPPQTQQPPLETQKNIQENAGEQQ